MEAFIGTILPWPMTWAPYGWMICDGRQLNNSQYQALYSLITITYGGTQTTFNLPDLRGRVPVGMDQGGVRGVPYQLGAYGGHNAAITSITLQNLPPHTHQASIGGSASGTLPQMSGNLKVSANNGVAKIPSATNVPAQVPDVLAPTPKQILAYGPADDATSWPVAIQGSGSTINLTLSNAAVAVSPTGGGQPFQVDVRQPFQVVNYIICNIGVYPQRD